MNKAEKKYIHFNPTQINNYGSGENSVQTVHRKVKEQIDNPMGFVDSVVTSVNSVFVIIAKSLKYSIFTVILPFISCALLGWFLFYWYVLNPNPSFAARVGQPLSTPQGHHDACHRRAAPQNRKRRCGTRGTRFPPSPGPQPDSGFPNGK